jgi:hypothetical protein
MSMDQVSDAFSALSVILRISAMICSIMAGAAFQRSADQNNVRLAIQGLILIAVAFACSGSSIALSGGR